MPWVKRVYRRTLQMIGLPSKACEFIMYSLGYIALSCYATVLNQGYHAHDNRVCGMQCLASVDSSVVYDNASYACEFILYSHILFSQQRCTPSIFRKKKLRTQNVEVDVFDHVNDTDIDTFSNAWIVVFGQARTERSSNSKASPSQRLIRCG